MAGWRYTASIPSYITGKDVDGEPVVLYRVNVLLQSLDAPDASSSPPSKTPFFVLRRYSQFRQLYDQVSACLGVCGASPCLALQPARFTTAQKNG